MLSTPPVLSVPCMGGTLWPTVHSALLGGTPPLTVCRVSLGYTTVREQWSAQQCQVISLLANLSTKLGGGDIEINNLWNLHEGECNLSVHCGWHNYRLLWRRLFTTLHQPANSNVSPMIMYSKSCTVNIWYYYYADTNSHHGVTGLSGLVLISSVFIAGSISI